MPSIFIQHQVFIRIGTELLLKLVMGIRFVKGNTQLVQLRKQFGQRCMLCTNVVLPWPARFWKVA